VAAAAAAVWRTLNVARVAGDGVRGA
jgi:hypothetical protein